MKQRLFFRAVRRKFENTRRKDESIRFYTGERAETACTVFNAYYARKRIAGFLSIIDSLWIGNLLGAKALGAAAVSSTIVLTVLSFILGLNNATLTILSQQKGKDDVKGMASYINAFVVLLTGLSIGFGAAGFFLSELLLRLLKTPESMIPLAETYLQIQFIGILFCLVITLSVLCFVRWATARHLSGLLRLLLY